MAANILLTIAASLLLLGSATATGYGKVENEVFHVAGKVLCQDCSQGWNEWVNGADPIKGGKVSVTCLDDRGKAIYFASDLTDDAGDFDITCNKYVNGKKINPQNCFLRLVSSPDPVCNVATNFAGGKSGVKLHRPTVVYRDILKYALGPFYYTTPMCDEPDISTPQEEEEENDSENYGKQSNNDDNGKQNNYDGSDGKQSYYEGDDGKQSNSDNYGKQSNYDNYGKQSNYDNYDGDGKQSNY